MQHFELLGEKLGGLHADQQHLPKLNRKPTDCSRTFASSKRGTLTSEGKYLNARKWQCSRLAAVDEGT